MKTPEGRPDDYTYALGRQGDEPMLLALKTTGTKEKKVEIQAYAIQPTIQQCFTRVTALPETDGNWSFIIADWNQETSLNGPRCHPKVANNDQGG